MLDVQCSMLNYKKTMQETFDNIGFRDSDLREAVKRLYGNPPQLSADFTERVLRALERDKKRRRIRRLTWYSLAAVAVFAAVAFLLLIPQVRERQELARYEGSYTMVDGQRTDDLELIKSDISEALAMAHIAEANVPSSDFASETERAILQATNDPEMHAVVQRILQ